MSADWASASRLTGRAPPRRPVRPRRRRYPYPQTLAVTKRGHHIGGRDECLGRDTVRQHTLRAPSASTMVTSARASRDQCRLVSGRSPPITILAMFRPVPPIAATITVGCILHHRGKDYRHRVRQYAATAQTSIPGECGLTVHIPPCWHRLDRRLAVDVRRRDLLGSRGPCPPLWSLRRRVTGSSSRCTTCTAGQQLLDEVQGRSPARTASCCAWSPSTARSPRGSTSSRGTRAGCRRPGTCRNLYRGQQARRAGGLPRGPAGAPDPDRHHLTPS
jgi:hypothetical protein